MNRKSAELWSEAIVAAGTVIRYGQWGRPVLVFPSEQGHAADFESNGMLAAAGGLIEAGRVKVYCVDSYDAQSWSNREIPLEDRAPRHEAYESWILGSVLPWIYADCGREAEVATLGCSLGAFHAANFALRRADKGIRHEIDLWGDDVPHDWPSWRAQMARHLPRFC
jgi:esterase/lipase superfamily enzyme